MKTVVHERVDETTHQYTYNDRIITNNEIIHCGYWGVIIIIGITDAPSLEETLN